MPAQAGYVERNDAGRGGILDVGTVQLNNRVRRRQQQQRRRRQTRITFILSAVVVAGIAMLIAVRSGGGGGGPQLSGLAQEGKSLAVQRSCVGCHGRNGEGGANHTGPPWVGLYLSTVSLADGGSVVADEAYLVESILQPKLKQTLGWGQMPEASLSADDLRAIIAYIKELTPPPTTPAGS